MYFLASECRFKSYKRNTNYIQLFGGVYPESIRSVRDPISCLDRLLHGADKEDLLRQYVTRFSSKLDSWKITPQRWKLKISITYQEIWGRSRITLCRQKPGTACLQTDIKQLGQMASLKGWPYVLCWALPILVFGLWDTIVKLPDLWFLKLAKFGLLPNLSWPPPPHWDQSILLH